MPHDVCSKLLHEPSIVRYLTTPFPKCCMHGGSDRHVGKIVVCRVEWIANPNPDSIEVRLNLNWTIKGNWLFDQKIVWYSYLCWSWRVASMTTKASWASCLASGLGWKIFTWLNDGVFGWTRTSFWIKFSSNRTMSSSRLNARVPSSSNWLLVIERRPIWFVIHFSSYECVQRIKIQPALSDLSDQASSSPFFKDCRTPAVPISVSSGA